jgi:hypothetical protein
MRLQVAGRKVRVPSATRGGIHRLQHHAGDPEICRFYTEEPIGFRGGIHKYAYTLNNPFVHVPSGLDVFAKNAEGGI